ncbi:uncharacterized protein LOC133532225 isoform X2 [Cydia pomonella]|uniref:uncharacterized protein LOC133532225 isoform X2 n=1 Tax=Cydia pomonella TaxID=82600 RepID=UPI002ADDEFAB|nr:uncharacterized protein LOC133532225 isoform X2 [Cydia pomonella]
MEKAKVMVIMPCCYHKMEQEKGRFRNFPLSDCLKEVFEKENGFEYMAVPFLRLGAQPPCLVEDNLEDSVFNLLARGVLQLYAKKHNCKLRRNKRKAVKTKSMDRNFETYIQDACTGFRLSHNSGPNTLKDKVDSPEAGDLSIDLDQLRSIWKDNSSSMVQKKVAIFILIQNCLQPVIENLILYDRIVYLKEKGLKNCQFKRIVNERISPRCLALLACK